MGFPACGWILSVFWAVEYCGVKHLLRSTALALALGFFMPAPNPVTGLVWNPSAYADPVTGQIPDWIKKSCCGPEDAHKLRVDQVHGPMASREAYGLLGQPDIPEASVNPENAPQFYVVDGYSRIIPEQQAQPSQDGNYWIFYRDYDGSNGHFQSGVYCFFVPMAM